MAHREFAEKHCTMTGLFSGERGNGFGSHFPWLLQTLLHVADGKNVLELGVGEYSTPLFHLFSMGKGAVSVEHDLDFYEVFSRQFASSRHSFVYSPDYSAKIIESEDWAVAFIDHLDERRKEDTRRLARRAEFLVIHDVHTGDDLGYSFRHRSDFDDSTAVVSDFHPVDFLRKI